LSVFAAGADLPAISTVCAGDDLPTPEVERALAELVTKSVVVFDGHRYHMLETIKEYGREQLPDSGTRAAHRDYYAALAADVGAHWFGPDQVRLLGLIRTEQANIRAALESCLTTPDQARAGLRMAADLWIFWVGCGQLREGSHWLDRLLAADLEPSPERVHALFVNSHLGLYQSDTAHVLVMLDECEALAARLRDLPHLAHVALNDVFGIDQTVEFLAWVALDEGDAERAVRLLGARVSTRRAARLSSERLGPATRVARPAGPAGLRGVGPARVRRRVRARPQHVQGRGLGLRARRKNGAPGMNVGWFRDSRPVSSRGAGRVRLVRG